MLDLLKSIWDRAASEGGVVSGTPVLFFGGVAFLSILASLGMWKVIDWAYQSKFDSQSSTIVSLGDRIKLRDDQISDYKEKLSGATPEEARKRIDMLELQIKALSPRRLSNEQKQILASILSKTRGVVHISHDMAAPDAKPFTSDLASAFQAAGWGVTLPMVMGIGNPPPTGVALRVRDPSVLTPIEESVKSALQISGVNFDVQGGLREMPPPSPRPAGFPSIRQDPNPDVELLLTTQAR